MKHFISDLLWHCRLTRARIIIAALFNIISKPWDVLLNQIFVRQMNLKNVNLSVRYFNSYRDYIHFRYMCICNWLSHKIYFNVVCYLHLQPTLRNDYTSIHIARIWLLLRANPMGVSILSSHIYIVSYILDSLYRNEMHKTAITVSRDYLNTFIVTICFTWNSTMNSLVDSNARQ